MKKKVSLLCLMSMLITFSVYALCFASSNQDLLDAVDKGDITKIEVLLANGGDPNAKSDDGYTALMSAATNGYTEIAKLLLDHKANVNAKDQLSYTPLIYAVQTGSLDIVRLLIDKNADINIKTLQNGNALHFAVQGGYFDLVKLLIQNSINVEVKDSQGKTALAIAKEKGYFQIADFIEEINANKPSYNANVTFKFYSSYAKEVYIVGDFNNWDEKATKLNKNGAWFSASVPVKDCTEYVFIVDGVNFDDPFSFEHVSDNKRPFIKLTSSQEQSNVDGNIKLGTSKHFEYFTKDNPEKVKDLEDIYQNLSERLVKPFFKEPIKAKIRYYGMSKSTEDQMPVPYAIPDRSEVYDLWDCASSHELIHLIVRVANGAFNEGMAQCFQREGNDTMREQNANLAVHKILEENQYADLLEIIDQGPRGWTVAYNEMASFIYYNIYVLKNIADFAKFLDDLSYNDGVDAVKAKYYKATNLKMEDVIAEWLKWAKSIDEKSDIYVKW